MSEQKDSQKVAPKLRFPEFQTASGWKNQPLTNLATRIIAKNKSGDVTRVFTNSASDGVVDQNDYFDREIANKDNLNGYYIIELGDYVYNPRISISAPVGPISKNKIAKGVMSPLYTVFRFHQINNDFYEHYFKTNHWHKYLYQVSNSGARHDRMNITNDDFMAMPIPVLSPEEQQKIADCLSSLDELIELQEQKLAALKWHKKGLMQQLFPSQNDLQLGKQIVYPKLRFPQFKDCKGWEVVRLGNVFNFLPTNSLSRDKLEERNGIIKNIHYGDIHTKFSALFDIEKENVPFISGAFIAKIRERHYCKEGDLIFADASEDLDDIGKAIEIVNLNNEILVSGLHTLLARPIEDHFSIGFLGHLFQSDSMKKQIQIEAQGAKVLGISAKRLNDILVICPSREEQQTIADCLSSLDSLISEQNQQIGSLKNHKKGLMQQLFPTLQ